MTIEEWRLFRETDYEVSNLGRIRRARPGRTNALPVGSIIRSHIDRVTGYELIGVRSGGRKRTMLVHGIVAEVFLGTRNKGFEVNHIDRNRSNNAASNLEYLTHSQNLRHSSANLARAVGKLTESDVVDIRRRLAVGETHASIASAYGVHKTNISCIARRTTWRYL